MKYISNLHTYVISISTFCYLSCIFYRIVCVFLYFMFLYIRTRHLTIWSSDNTEETTTWQKTVCVCNHVFCYLSFYWMKAVKMILIENMSPNHLQNHQYTTVFCVPSWVYFYLTIQLFIKNLFLINSFPINFGYQNSVKETVNRFIFLYSIQLYIL